MISETSPKDDSTPATLAADCCIVGGGPGGVMLAYLLARQGIEVVLLETHKDFDRAFRGDTLHASVLDCLDQVGLADRVMKLANSKVTRLQFISRDAQYTIAEFSRLKTKFPYVAIIPQVKFLDFLVEEASRYPNFKLLMEANAQDLIEENGRVVGVRYKQKGEIKEARCHLTVGADGRGSRLRSRSGLALKKLAPPMDVVWLTLPRSDRDEDETTLGARVHAGDVLITINRGDYWQLGYVILKKGYKDLKSEGIEHLREKIVGFLPGFKDRVETLTDWKQCAVLAVDMGRLEKWHRPGLLLIGDAAHIMSPVGGVGINYAIQDAVAAANQLTEPLKTKSVTDRDLQSVQKRRERATRFIQGFQSLVQNRIIAGALKSDQAFVPPLPMRLIASMPMLRGVSARLIAYGLTHERIRHVEPAPRVPSPAAD